MKKLLIAATVVALGIVANAATYNWTAKVDWITSSDADNDSTLEGFVAYVFDANAYTMASVTSSLGKGDMTALNNALGSSYVDGGELSFSGAGLSDDGATPPYSSIYLVVLDAANSDGAEHYFAYDGFSPIEITDAVTADAARFTAGDLYTGDTSTWAAVPEPTSGLLMLLGMAGLALRRRRA